MACECGLREGGVSGGKKITDSVITGDAGVALIHTVVSKMRHVWREWNGSLDAGRVADDQRAELATP
jgi:hypothetical protein